MIDKEKVRDLHKQGYKLLEIAKEVGCTKQYVAVLCGGIYANRKRRVSLNRKIPYIGLRNWLFENQISNRKLSYMLKEGVKTDERELSFKLYGKMEFRYSEIVRILELTGMTFEEAFRKEDRNG